MRKELFDMIKVNVVFDNSFDDADIIAIPDEISSHIEEIGQEFLCWVTTAEDSDYWTMTCGERCVVAETDGFIKWLNATYCKELEKSFVVERNTDYNPAIKVIEF